MGGGLVEATPTSVGGLLPVVYRESCNTREGQAFLTNTVNFGGFESHVVGLS